MHSICLLESVSRSDGGIFEAELALQRELRLAHGVEIDIIGMEDRFSAKDALRWLPLKPRAIKVQGPGALGYSRDLLPALDTKADLLYAATLWKYASWAALQWAERTGKPMIVAPHGSLDAWALRNAAWKKRIAAALFKNRQFKKAACLRALSTAEAASFREYELRGPITIIPNGVDLPIEGSIKYRSIDELAGMRKILFLGRLHPKKGLPNLIRAFKNNIINRGSNQECRWQLIVAGWDQVGHESELKSLCDELGLSWSDRGISSGGQESQTLTPESEIHFYGPAFGQQKEDLLRSSDAFILPSLSEGLPMSVLEGWAYSLPVLMTEECNMPEGFAAGAALRITTDIEGIASGLDTLFSMSEAERLAMGDCGKELVKENFTWERVASQMKEVYDWLLGGGPAPASVRLN